MTPKRAPRRIENGEAPYILSPKNDYVFRLLFGDDGNEDLLASLLSSILHEEIEHVVVKNPYILKLFSEDKEAILDIKAAINSKKLVDIEIQLWKSPTLMSRILFYWARLYASQIKQGNDYSVLQKTISILILDDLIHSSVDYHARTRLHDCKQHITLTDMIEVHVLELPKLHNLIEQDKSNTLLQWMLFFNAQTREELIMVSEANPVIKKATDLLMTMSRDEETRLMYEAREEYLLGRQIEIQGAKGEGREEGREKGKIEGRENERKDIAMKLIEEGMNDEFIGKITGLDIAVIRSLHNNR